MLFPGPPLVRDSIASNTLKVDMVAMVMLIRSCWEIHGRVMKKKIVVTRRVDFPPRGPLSRWKYKNLADRIIVISRCIEEVMKKTGVNEERLRYVPSAINVEWLEKRKDPSYLLSLIHI